MRLPVTIRPEAEKDIEEAANWYEQRREGLGDAFLDEIQNVLVAISERPAAYAVLHRGVRRALIKRFPFGVFYRLEDDGLVVFAVMHGRRHPRRWMERV